MTASGAIDILVPWVNGRASLARKGGRPMASSAWLEVWDARRTEAMRTAMMEMRSKGLVGELGDELFCDLREVAVMMVVMMIIAQLFGQLGVIYIVS